MGSQTQRRANSSSAAYLLWDVGKALHASKSQCPQLLKGIIIIPTYMTALQIK